MRDTILVQFYFWIYGHKISSTAEFLQHLCQVLLYLEIRQKLEGKGGCLCMCMLRVGRGGYFSEVFSTPWNFRHVSYFLS